MTEITVRDLVSYLMELIETGSSDKKVRVSVTYDNCEHIQDLQGVHCFDEINWITLMGGTKND